MPVISKISILQSFNDKSLRLLFFFAKQNVIPQEIEFEKRKYGLKIHCKMKFKRPLKSNLREKQFSSGTICRYQFKVFFFLCSFGMGFVSLVFQYNLTIHAILLRRTI